MARKTFEEQLHCDIQALRGRYAAPKEIRVTRCGAATDEWVSWDVDMLVPPDRMDADALQLYGQLGALLNRDPYRLMEEGVTSDMIGYVVTSKGAAH